MSPREAWDYPRVPGVANALVIGVAAGRADAFVSRREFVASLIVQEGRLTLLEPRGDERGSLIALEATRDVPFEIKRVYYLFGTVADAHRGFHAHRQLEQFAVCVSGSCIMKLSDGRSEQDYVLDDPRKGLLIGKMIWHEMRDFSADAVLMVLASDLYDEQDYIRNHDSFMALVNEEPSK